MSTLNIIQNMDHSENSKVTLNLAQISRHTKEHNTEVKIELKKPTPYELVFLNLLGYYSILDGFVLSKENKEYPLYQGDKTSGNVYFKGQLIIENGRALPENILRARIIEETNDDADYNAIRSYEDELIQYNYAKSIKEMVDKQQHSKIKQEFYNEKGTWKESVLHNCVGYDVDSIYDFIPDIKELKPKFDSPNKANNGSQNMDADAIKGIINELKRSKTKVASNLGFLKSIKATTAKVKALDNIINGLKGLFEGNDLSKQLKENITLSDFHQEIKKLYDENSDDLNKKRSRFPISFFDGKKSTTEQSLLGLMKLISADDDSNLSANQMKL